MKLEPLTATITSLPLLRREACNTVALGSHVLSNKPIWFGNGSSSFGTVSIDHKTLCMQILNRTQIDSLELPFGCQSFLETPNWAQVVHLEAAFAGKLHICPWRLIGFTSIGSWFVEDSKTGLFNIYKLDVEILLPWFFAACLHSFAEQWPKTQQSDFVKKPPNDFFRRLGALTGMRHHATLHVAICWRPSSPTAYRFHFRPDSAGFGQIEKLLPGRTLSSCLILH